MNRWFVGIILAGAFVASAATLARHRGAQPSSQRVADGIRIADADVDDAAVNINVVPALRVDKLWVTAISCGALVDSRRSVLQGALLLW